MKKDIRKLIEAVKSDYYYGFLFYEIMLMVGLVLRNIEYHFFNNTALFYTSKAIMAVSMLLLTWHTFFKRHR